MASTLRFSTLVGALALLHSLAVVAQQVPVGPGQPVPAVPRTPPPTATPDQALLYRTAPPAQRADKMSQEIARQLGLDAGTTAKVRAAALVRAQKIDEIQNGLASNKAKNTALQANTLAFKQTLQTILTPAQYAQYAGKSAKSDKGKNGSAPPSPAPRAALPAGY